MMNMIFMAILIGVYFILAWTLNLAGKPHKQVILENTLAKENLEHPLVKALATKYRKTNFSIATLFSLLTLPLLLVSFDSIMMILFWLLIIGPIVIFYLCQIYFIRQMHQLIVENNWQLPVKPLIVDTQLIMQKNKKIVSPLWFLPALIFLVISSVYSLFFSPIDGAWLLVSCSWLLMLLAYGSWVAVKHLPVRPLTDNQKINQQYNDLTKHHWSLLMISISWTILPLLFIPMLSLTVSAFLGQLFAIFLVLICLLYSGFTVWYLLSLRKKQDQLLAQIPSYRYIGDDQYWRFGMYINPNDSRLFLPDRIGMNMSVNLGRPIGKVLTGLIGVIIIVAMFVSVVPLYLYDFTANPFQLEMTEDTITMSAPFVASSDISIADITAVDLIDEIDGSVLRTNGLATTNYSTGHFTVSGTRAMFYIDHRSTPILHITTKERDYYFTHSNPQQTMESYQLLQEVLSRR